jgi:DNA repair photolyase
MGSRGTNDIERGLELARRVHQKYRPVFDRLGEPEWAALAWYFLPHRSRKDVLGVTRPRVVKWYCPFADQRAFPSGHRYCINVYTGCAHRCQYCYATGYVARRPSCKERFREDLAKDLDDLDAYDVPPAPAHVSNSTDPLQPLDEEHRDTLHTLQRLAERRHRFTTVTLLTKNPAALMDERYIEVLKRLNELSADHASRAESLGKDDPPLRIECSLALFDDRHRRLLDVAAPSVESRMEGIRFLREENLPVILRIDPLFPRDPLLSGKTMSDFGLPDLQPLSDLEKLVGFAREVGARHVVYSMAKITRPRQGPLPAVMEKMKQVYRHLASPERPVFRGGSWRLPDRVAADRVVGTFLELCRRHGIRAKTCKANLISTP